MHSDSKGLLAGVGAYALWGIFPLYWPLLEPAGAVEILAHRVAWSVVTMLALTVLVRRTGHLRAIWRDRRTALILSGAAVVIALNWGGFIYGVNHDQVLQVSLGYFINPLVTVLLGVLVLGERLRPWQWTAIGLAFVAVVGITVEYGKPPWISFILAGSFATYGLAKKKANVGAVESLTFETLVIAPLAIGYLLWLGATGRGNFTRHGVAHALLLTTTGLVTAVPLILFGAAAIRVSMTTIGLLQYMAPILHFILGLWVFGEQMSTMRWVGFILVWVALVIFTTDAVRHRRRQLHDSAQASAL